METDRSSVVVDVAVSAGVRVDKMAISMLGLLLLMLLM